MVRQSQQELLNKLSTSDFHVPEFTYLAARTMFSNRAKGVGATKMVRNKNKKYKQSNQWSQRRKIMQASRQHIIYVRLPNCENLYIILVFICTIIYIILHSDACSKNVNTLLIMLSHAYIYLAYTCSLVT